MISLGDEAGMKVNTFDMFWEVAWNVKARAIWTKGISHQQKMQIRSHTKKGYTQNTRMQKPKQAFNFV